MEALVTFSPLALGGIIVIAICYKVFTDKNVTNYIGYGLLAALALCALPSIQHFSYDGSFGKISADLQQKSDTLNAAVLSQSADLQSQVTLVNKKVDSLVDKLNARADVQAQITPAYKQNSLAQVFVYYAAGAQATANKIRDFLLDAGFRSSASFTDYQELSRPLPSSGTIRLVHTDQENSKNLANTIRSKLQEKFPQFRQLTDQSVFKLRSGDVQIQVF